MFFIIIFNYSIHTSAGVPAPLSDFIAELEHHLPWRTKTPIEGRNRRHTLTLPSQELSCNTDLLLDSSEFSSSPTSGTSITTLSHSNTHGSPMASTAVSCTNTPMDSAAATVTDDCENADWCLSLQMEGASAVLAAVDMLTQLRHIRYLETEKETQRLAQLVQSHVSNDGECDCEAIETTPVRVPVPPPPASKPISSWKIGVGATSYHGPPSTSPGSAAPLNAAGSKHNQVLYPVPSSFTTADEYDVYLVNFSVWLETHASTLSCLLIEPQWGSSQCALPWNRLVLSAMIDLCHHHGVLVLADEIMCGLGRHGQGTLFLSEAWGLDVDAVTFGKAVAAGAYPMSGAILRRGATALGATGRTVMQSHTYSGGNVRALLTATSLLQMLPTMYCDVEMKGRQLESVMRHFEHHTDGLFQVHGLGLMWGALLNHTIYSCRPQMPPVKEFLSMFQENCLLKGVLPYFVPVGGFMVTPLFDVPSDTIAAIGTQLIAAYELTMVQIGCVRLFVSFFGNTIPVQVTPTDLVATIKKMFRVKVSYCLSYNGAPLKEVNEKGYCVTLADCDIHSGATVAITVY